jgi:oligopeptide transport system substrate-binding protein
VKHVFVRLSACLLLVASFSCSGGKPKAAPGGASILHVNLGAEVQNLDPHLVTGVPEHRACSALFEGLTNIDPATLQPVPGIAASWSVSPDALTYTFHLRPEAKWSNGDPLGAEDFVYSWKRELTPALGAEYAYLLHCIRNAKAYAEGRITDFDQVGVKARDAHTLEVQLEAPTPYFLAMQIHQAWLPVHRATIERHGKPEDRNNPWTRPGSHVGNGPYRLAAWRPNEYMDVVPNEHYWDAARIRLGGIRFYPIDNLMTEERSFRSGALHITEDIPLDKIPVYQRENPAVLRLDPYLGVYYYRINVTRPPFNDRRVRRALSMALDREQITANVMKAGERPAYHYVPPGCGDYESRGRIPFDAAGARALLAEAGFPEGRGLPPIEILYNTSENHKRIAEAVQRIWKEGLGVDVRLLNQDWKVYLDTMNQLDYTLARSGWIADVVDPINFLECYVTNSGNNRTGFASPDYDALIEAAGREADTGRRRALLQQAEDLLLEEMPIIPVYFYTRKFLMATEVRGYTPNVLGYVRWKDLELAMP